MATDSPPYVVETIRCKACEARDSRRDEWQKNKDASTAGLFFAVDKHEGADVV